MSTRAYVRVPSSRRHLTQLALAAGLGLAMRAHAQTLYWDTNGATAGSGNAGGNWDAGTNWTTDSTGGSATVGWTDGNAVIFSAGTDGTGSWTSTIAGTVDPNSITFAQNGGKTVNGGNITIGGGLALSSSGRSNSDTFAIGSKLTGTGSISIAANGDTSDTGGGTPGKFSLNNTANDFVGNVTISSGVVDFAGDGVFGNAANDIVISGGGLVATAPRTLPATRDIVLSGGGDKIFRIYGSQSLTINGAITGTGGVRHTDGGTLTLNGNNSFTGNLTTAANGTGRLLALGGVNTYTGYTHITGGSGLRLDVNNALPDATDVLMYGNTTFNVNGRTDTIGGLLVGSAGDTTATVQLGSGGNLTVTDNSMPGGSPTNIGATFYGKFTGTGTVGYNNPTFNGLWDIMNTANDFTGTWNITQGRLRMIPNAGADAALGNAANDLVFNGTPVTTLGNNEGKSSFQVQNGTSFTLGAGRDIVLNAGKEGTLHVWGGTTMTVNGKITGAGILRKEDGGTLQLNNTTSDYTGETRLTLGTITLGASGVIPDASLLRLASGTLNLNGQTETVGGLSSVQPSNSAVLTGATINGGGALTVNQASTETYGGTISSALSLTKSGAGTLTLSGSNSFTGGLTVSGGAVTAALGTSSATNSGIGAATSPLVIGTGATLNVTDTGTGFYWAGNISGAGTFNQNNGSGIGVRLSGNNASFTGTYQQQPSTRFLMWDSAASGSAAAKWNLSANTGSNFAAVEFGTNVAWNGSLASGSTPTIHLGELSGTSSTIQLGNFTSFGGQTGTTTFSVGALNTDSTFAGKFVDTVQGSTAFTASTVNLTKVGNGTLTLTGAHTHTGVTTVSAGTLALQLSADYASNISNSANVRLYNSGGGAAVTGTLSGGGTWTVDGPGGGTVFDRRIILRGVNNPSTSDINVVNAGKLWIDRNNNSIADSVTVNIAPAASFTVFSDNNPAFQVNETIGGLAGSGNVFGYLGSGTVHPALTVGGGNVSASFSGNISDQNGSLMSLTKTGTGTQTLSGNNTYGGATTINQGTLAVSGGSALPNNGVVSLANTAGAQLLLNSSETVGSIQGGGATGGTINLQGNTLTTGGNNGTTAFGGLITGTGGSLVKTGTGTLTLSNSANDFSGKVAVNQGTLHLTGASGTLGLGNPAAAPDAIQLGSAGSTGTLRISNGDLSLAVGRGITLGGNGGVLDIDTTRTLNVSTYLDADAVGSTLTKAGAGTFSLTANADVNALVVAGGTYNQVSGQTQIFNTATGLAIQNGGTYRLSGGTLKVDKITTTGTGAFVWGGGTLTARSTNGNLGTTDHSAAGYQAVRTGYTATIQGDVTTGGGSVLAMHGSPTLYLNSGVRFNNWAIDGDLNLLDGSDTLEFALNPYLLRPFSSAGVGAIETGSLPLITWTGTFHGGVFDNVTGIFSSGAGFTQAVVPVTDPTALATDTWYIEYDAAASTVWFHYKVSGYVPEPGSFGLLAAGALGLRLSRILANRRRRITVPEPIHS